MGIPGSGHFFKPVCVQRCISELRGKKVLVDGSSVLHKQCIGRRNGGTEPLRKDGKSINHIYSIFMFVTRLLEKGIMPIFVFDGKAPVEKAGTISERRKVKAKAIEKCNELVDKKCDEYAKNYKKSFHVTKVQINECKELLRAMGIIVIQSLQEADAQLAALSHIYSDEIAGIITEDPDVLVYAGSKMFKNFSFITNSYTEISRLFLLTYLKEKANNIRSDNNLEPIDVFTHIDFLNFAIMMGTDYKIANYDTKLVQINAGTSYEKHENLFKLFVLSDCNISKMVNMMKLLNELSIIDTHENMFIVPDNYVDTMEKIKHIYLKSTVIDPRTISLRLIEPKPEKIFKIMCVDNELSQSFVTYKIKQILVNHMVHLNMSSHNSQILNSLSGYRYKFCKKHVKSCSFKSTNRFDAIATI